MKASELIERLQTLVAKFGDCEVVAPAFEGQSIVIVQGVGPVKEDDGTHNFEVEAPE